MIANLKTIAIGIAVVFGLCLAAYQYGKSQAQTIVKTQEVEKVVEKKDIVTVVREVVKKDGTKETITTIEDRSTTNTRKEITTKQTDWFLAAGTTYNLGSHKQDYNIQVNRRILGDVFIGVYGNTNKDIGVQIGMTF